MTRGDLVPQIALASAIMAVAAQRVERMKTIKSRSLFGIYPSKIAARSRSCVDVIGNLSGLKAVVFLWRIGPLLCDARAICGTRSPRVTSLSSLYEGK